MQPFLLAPHVSACVSGQHVVLMDLERDKYVAVDPAHRLGGRVRGWPVDSAQASGIHNADRDADDLIARMLAHRVARPQLPQGAALPQAEGGLNDVPDRVRRYSRPRKGAIEEHARQTLEHNRGLLRELLLDGHLVRERIIDRRRLAEVLSGRATRTAPGPGELLEYAGIEAWLRRWAERPRRGGLSAPSISMAEG
ncbi:MAG TPA: hypothetical protein VJ738_09650 [Steroidobacteraceae bacterium]|nr:hypothetical protein [Steroidobacteraceae bacterium]